MILTGREPFDDLGSKEYKRKVMHGDRPKIDRKMWHQADHGDVHAHAMITAINMCWLHDPRARASASDVKQFLADHMKKHAGSA